jgi:hypothetical protein
MSKQDVLQNADAMYSALSAQTSFNTLEDNGKSPYNPPTFNVETFF